ncbi:MAG: BamA/TamA family outer membrane protein [Deltaproteobacteria bacterium]|nr:BamA/TamA family outer membrane protein [Deltaproteobacteria bacterium]
MVRLHPQLHSAGIVFATGLTVALAAVIGTEMAAANEARPVAAEEVEAAAPDPVEKAGKGRSEYDPWAGMDQSGRIPKVELPDDIDKPERWRYIPEGRIKPGNVFERFLVSSFIVPFFFANGDVGVGGGVGLTDIDFRRQRRREFASIFGSYTSKGQQSYGISWRRMLKTRDLPTGGVIQEERSWLSVRLSYRKTLTRRFFGFGPDTRPIDESSYTDEAVLLGLGWASSMPKPVDDLVLELSTSIQLHNLSAGTVQGVPATQTAYPGVFIRWDDYNFATFSGELRWDTRDAQRNPYRGHTLGVRVDAPLVQTNWDVGAVFTIFATKVFRVPGLFHDGGDANEQHPPTDVVAFGIFSRATVGTIPFYLQPSLGGSSTLRGYVEGRWRDRASWHASAEYRFWVIARGIPVTRNIRIERIGLAAFYDVGAVAPDVPGIFSSRVAMSYGPSLRISLERSAIFRVDFGFSDEGWNFAAGFGLSF